MTQVFRPKVVHCRLHVFDVYIGRPGEWGNPFEIGKDGTRKQVIAKYRDYIQGRPDLLGKLSTLKGKRLGCWCAPRACHGDVLADLVQELFSAEGLV